MQKTSYLAMVATVIICNGISLPQKSKPVIKIGQAERQINNVIAYANAFKAHCSAYGFRIDSCWTPKYMSDFKTYDHNYTDEKGTLNYNIEMEEVLLQNINSMDTFAFAYRVVISPKQVRDWGVMGIGSHGDDWIVNGVKTTVKLREHHHLADWAPENAPASSTTNIGVGYGESGPSISASVNFDHSELTVISSSSTADEKYETNYVVATRSTVYTKNAIKFYGFYTFVNDYANYAWVDVTHECRLFGTAWTGLKTETFSHTY